MKTEMGNADKNNFFDDDIQLMLLFQKGEEACFEQLVDRHKNRVFNLAYRFLGNYQEAEDLAQEVFIKIYNAKNTYRPKAKFTTWLYAICKNTCLKKIRQKRSNFVSINKDIELGEDTIMREIADTNAVSPAASALRNEQSLIVKEAINSLPANQKIAVILNRFDQLSYEEISKTMGCSVKAVKSLLHRAKINLKEKLAYYLKI